MIQSMCRGGVRCTVSSSSEDQRIRGSKQGQRVRGADEVQMAEVEQLQRFTSRDACAGDCSGAKRQEAEEVQW